MTVNEIVKPGVGLLFMKIGTHANESLADIIARKTEEIRNTGFGMWGYGGNTCHPGSMVQPFARDFAQRGQTIYLCMEEMNSNHFGKGVAAEYSADGITWQEIPQTIEVRGSRYALIIDELREERFTLPLDQTRVPVGPSIGRLGSRYVKGRVDKACLEVLNAPELSNEADLNEREINLLARLKDPYAVFLRGQR
ncbi:hypothetical protein [Mesorhizobium sp.]|uniref:hypothetical protein n=1 Tax=Mesorhizobium sp. TaxID=1871066 RepID=UPI000FE5766C|nr:hypothetical protein [Mesorhizobium sp.]RWK44846.1 MAG: hypothetical protein EOR47_33745 [Mesorhizobium sp.]TIP39011.1 MAG: hypothetical protein E5X62_32390 [Mesorhizobium sp.]TIQ13003.1 MAG: hypothetical protein E5X57_10300 [Mesorhizobium sp.]